MDELLPNVRQPRRTGGRLRLRLWLIVTLVVVFAVLGVSAYRVGSGGAWDHDVLHWLIEQRRGWLTATAIALTEAGSPIAMGLLAVIAAALLWWRRRAPLQGIVVLSTLVVASGISTVTKVIVGAHRPPRVVQLVREVDPSFPSGHVTGTLALLGVLAVVIGRDRRAAVRVALAAGVAASTVMVAATRLYLGVHWLTDVCGGAMLGAAAVVGSSLMLDKVAGSRDGTADRPDESAAVKASPMA
ncbi:membrane-associated phospholipid phosphatase [Mycolicibacterium chubuense NBB4]|uniref:Membrane-associated phospholipid phosphatase n=1 Tax=Mycolicibacterium chubuense (strain NBB4) TaxID=710421 RepID=I4BIA1_MYCCN|nr:phosphatase PAP2 family protein [Mycolicibacterium chubuense]AFM17008.1 membrane-associated phospholipid phosphatase [Mycolicibacterium chubuense NBB4]